MMIFFLGFLGFSYLSAASFGTNHSHGVVVLYHSVLECRSVVCEFDGCFVLVEFGLRGSVFRVASIYATNCNPDCDTFFVRCIDSIDLPIRTILCGDFNNVLDRVLDRRRSCPFDVSCESSALLSAMLLDYCVVDIWRERHLTDSAFTWFQRDGALASRIDLIGYLYALVLGVFCRHSTMSFF